MIAKVEQKREYRAGNRRVGKIPKLTKYWIAKRDDCAKSLRKFCKFFRSEKFFLPFSPDHDKAIEKLQRVAKEGGQFALAMPRGSGKTELVKATSLWAILYGYRRFVVVIGATAKDAERVIDDIKLTLETSERLHAAFPEATHCIRDMNGIVHRARVQSFDNGEPTGLRWTKDAIQLARVKGAKCAGAVIRTAGLTGSIRGMSATGPKGETFRPDLVLLDDPQDRESATSPQQTADRERIIRGDVLGLAGKTKAISAVMPCTVIAKNDLADRFLDREKNPQWNGERTQRVISLPANQALWDRYFDIRATELRSSGTSYQASEFYKSNRADLDCGAVLSWPEAFDRDRYGSAIEEAMVRRHDDPEAFAAEDQNDPQPLEADLLYALDPKVIASKFNSVKRGFVPADVTRLTAMVDVGNKILWWIVCGWTEGFSGHVIDYGTFPQQNRSYFVADDARPSLEDEWPAFNEDSRIFAAISRTVGHIVSRPYPRQDDSGELRVERCFVDSGRWPKPVATACRQSSHAAVLIPSKGWGIGSGRSPMVRWVLKQGQRRGDHWVMQPNTEGGHGRLVIVDVNYWKSFVAKALQTPVMGIGCLQLFGEKAETHHMFAEHLTSEYRSGKWSAMGDQSEQDLWAPRPGRRDNHWWDCLVGCAAAASFAGLSFSAATAAGNPVPPREPKKRIKMSEVFARKQMEAKR